MVSTLFYYYSLKEGTKLIQVKNVSKQYSNKKVLDNISVEIEKGKLTALIGPNGAGKTTLLNMVGRLLPYDTGEIEIDDLEVRDWNSNDLAKRLAILKQANSMHAKITVSELMAFGRFPHRKGRIGPKCRELIQNSLEWLGLEEYKHAYLNSLSGGQLQRAYIGLVLCQDTDYILLDEPLNNLDMKYSVEIMKILRYLVDELGRTVVVVLHDINYAAAYADNIIAFKNGSVFINDSVENVLQKPIIDELFDTDVEIIEHNNQRYCLYYNDSLEEIVNNFTETDVYSAVNYYGM